MNASVDVLNMLRKFERTYMVAGLKEEASDVASIHAAMAELIEVLGKIVRDEEQGHFESWLGRYSPSGDAESVHTQWKESSDFADLYDIWSDAIDVLARVGGATHCALPLPISGRSKRSAMSCSAASMISNPRWTNSPTR